LQSVDSAVDLVYVCHAELELAHRGHDGEERFACIFDKPLFAYVAACARDVAKRHASVQLGQYPFQFRLATAMA
jgi:hypothetical protein